MTPEDVAAMAEEIHEHGSLNKVDALALCDALEAARADLEHVEATNCAVTEQALEAFERADRAEAERDKWRAQADEDYRTMETLRERAAQAEDTLTFERQANEKNCAELLVALAALARVRALLDRPVCGNCRIDADLRHALDGGDQ